MKSSRIVRAGIRMRASVYLMIFNGILSTIIIYQGGSVQIAGILSFVLTVISLTLFLFGTNDLIKVNEEIDINPNWNHENQNSAKKRTDNEVIYSDPTEVEIRKPNELNESRSSEKSGDIKVRCSLCKVYAFVEEEVKEYSCFNCASKQKVIR
jgi:hypothetical protein